MEWLRHYWPQSTAARAAWLEDAPTAEERQAREWQSFLSCRDTAGRVVDFHALRHTAGSLLAAAGVHPKVAQSIMRHSTIDLTMSRYTHVFAGQEVNAVAALPDFGKPAKELAKATGTYNAQAAQDSPARPRTGDHEQGRLSSHPDSATCSEPMQGAGGDARKNSDSVLGLCLAHRGGFQRTSADRNGREDEVSRQAEDSCKQREGRVFTGRSEALAGVVESADTRESY